MGSLSLTYYNPKAPGSFGGVEGLRRVTKKPVKEWLQSQDAYTLHKPIRRRFARRRVVVAGIDDQWQADLVDVSSLGKQNQNYKYLLTCIDVFSKYAWIEKLRAKNGKTLVKAFSSILRRSKRKPRVLQTDKGGEFVNNVFQRWLKTKNIHFFTTHNEETKASIVERFNRTIKSRMWRYFTSKNTRRYTDVLSDLLSSYNHSYHRSIKRSPASVSRENEEVVWQNLYGQETLPKVAKIPEGSLVRISTAKKTFHKGYLQNWSDELFLIERATSGSPPYYHLKDLGGESLEGTFYEEELQRVTKTDDVFKVESILDKRRRGKKSELLVKWLGYPAKFNSWISAKGLVRYA